MEVGFEIPDFQQGLVGISTTALGLALIVRIREAYGTIEEDEIQDLDDRQ